MKEKTIRDYGEQLRKLYNERSLLTERYENAAEREDGKAETRALSKDITRLDAEIDNLIENDYAEAVFNEYCKEKPDLTRVYTGETVSWDDAFGSDFEAISKSLRHSLVGLVEDPGKYQIKT
ncbi:hypothetical protein [Butyrivibrio sp. MC2021]|uniref:hypothetical protein n=1 Tax=Butyrivibrio sp. MC2021 TaxID=1408306 RepID=UPI00047BABD2|nr:hypothetical protein [Butyrivibrio sp. MC2021]